MITCRRRRLNNGEAPTGSQASGADDLESGDPLISNEVQHQQKTVKQTVVTLLTNGQFQISFNRHYGILVFDTLVAFAS